MSDGIDRAAGLEPRTSSRLSAGTITIVLLSVVAGALVVTAVVLSILAYSRLGDELDTVDRLADAQTRQLRVDYTQRRRTLFHACEELERVKLDARAVLELYDVTPPLITTRRAFARADCRAFVEQRVPANDAPPGADLALP